ncbi:branched-chain amino acid ABC transporter permease [Natronomonas gomsonensis]|jgi:branched-chain amino acid transport system permease protein|uniref:branched-chain amino acid ABC transporter permease n=1 Tax=Natronomonas gomsonensis TaxID=1046043 RepID=UPI0020CA46F2|nr:branched-chain amino acid ABC transporter permease [Natronomonas gomsonensis]MCY4730207.1 branched-chain amino acid ABC transporter permease [Natronomonas gomsonensis]
MVSAITIATNVLMLGALYSLVAIGFTLIFGVGGVLNLSHGAIITVGAYSAYAVDAATGSIVLGAIAAAVISGAFSLALYKGLISKVRHNPVTVLILTLVVAIVVEQLMLVIFGGEELLVPQLLDGSITVLSDSIQLNRILVFVLSWVLIGGLFYFVNRTRTGKAILATSMSDKGAALVGIDSEQVYSYTWVLAGALAGLAGLFLASFQTANPLMGRNPLLLSFSIVVLGGLGSIRGSVIGAYLISFLDQMTIQFLSERLAGVSALVVLVLVLLIRPKGLFGRELVEE